jgi:glycosyltransferase involved in cell wall biosynthesis
MITHVMDDWFSFAVRPGLLKKFWLKKLNGRVAALFAGSSLHLSICQYMSDEYLKRYGYHFFPFHHTVDPELWDGGREDPRPLHRPVHLLYAGRLGNGVDQTLLKVCRVVEKMGDEGQALVLEIQTRDLDQSFAETLKGFRHVSVTPPISYAKLPEKFASADILLIPCDFEGAGLTFIRYSMPTKVSEYMATGTPILVVGPPGTALVEYAKKGWAGLCLSGEEMKIARAIEELISSPAHRQHVIQTARRLVLENHDEKTVINQFRQKLVLLGSLVSSVN